MSDQGRPSEESLADLTAIVAAMLAGVNDRIYPAHARDIVDPVERLVADAERRGDAATAKSLRHSLEGVRRMIPPR